MANLRIGAVLAGATLTFLVLVQLLALLRHGHQTPESSFSRNFNQWRSRANTAAATDGLFLVGAGKADVTG